jgi:hypothetical protein
MLWLQIESTGDIQPVAGDGSDQKILFMDDFNGRRANVPLELCGSWLVGTLTFVVLSLLRYTGSLHFP